MKTYSGSKIATFRERFSELCDSSPMNDSAIANGLNVSRQTVCSWRAGTRSPKRPMVISIANYFNTNVAWLMGFDVSAEPDKPSGRVVPIVVPDSERFVKLVHYMPQDEYMMVMQAFERAEKRLKEEEENQ